MTTPPPPSNLTGTSPTSDTALLNWSSPPMVVVANYRVYRDGKYLTCTHDTNFVDTGLQPGTSYNYGIDDVAGDGGASLKSTITVVTKLDNVPPLPPTNVVATAVGPQSISVSWVNADVIDTNAAATEVDLELDDTTSGAAIPVTLSPDSIDYEFDGLAMEDTYTCAVWAYNNNGTSMRVVSNAVTLPIPLPVAITGPATATASDSATVTGTIYANGYPYPNAYFIWSDGNTSNQTPSVNYGADAGNLGQSASATLTGLQPNTTYSYQLVADNNDLKSYGDNLSFTIQATTQYADLSISATVSPKYTVGQSVSIPITVVRSGGQLPSSPGTVTVALYGPTQSSFNPAATPSWTGTVNSSDLNSSGTASVTATLNISSGLSSGAYNIFAVVDPANQYVESNKNNNVQTQIVNITQAVTVTVISPAGGATWNLDDSVTISWTATDPDKQTGYFEMDLSTDGGVNYSKISGWTSNTSVGWKVANVQASNSCYIKVIAFDQTQNQLGFGTSGKFTIQSLTPIVTTGSADITATPITISGTVNPNGLNTSAYFMWGLTSGYGNSTSVQTLGNGTSALPITASLPTSLLNGTTYHYTIVATNSSGSSIGNDQTFTPGQETGLPDLTISFSGVGSSYAAGAAVPINITVNRTGGYLPAGGTVTVSLYLSFSPTIYDSGDLVLSDVNLAPNEQFSANVLNSNGSQTASLGFTIPPTDLGTFYLIAVVDPLNQYKESNKSNNATIPGKGVNVTAVIPVTVTVTSPALNSANIPPAWYLGDTQTITWSASDPSSQIAAFSIYLSTDGGITYPQLITNSTFAVSDYYNYNWVVANTAGSGFSNNCMIEVVALDAGGNALASGNSSALIIAHKPSIAAVFVPASTYWGDTISISWAVNDPDSQIGSYAVMLNGTTLYNANPNTNYITSSTTTSARWTVPSPDNPTHLTWSGGYAVEVMAWDIQNNNLVSDVTSSSSFTIAPITITTSANYGPVDPNTGTFNITFSWSVQNDPNNLVSSFDIAVLANGYPILFPGNVGLTTTYSFNGQSGSSYSISVSALDSKGFTIVY